MRTEDDLLVRDSNIDKRQGKGGSSDCNNDPETEPLGVLECPVVLEGIGQFDESGVEGVMIPESDELRACLLSRA